MARRGFRQSLCLPDRSRSMLFSKTPRCQIVPLAGKQVAFSVDGRERLRWHADDSAPRPFLFPLIGPAGYPLTRIGHPGAPNHDHHRSIWFAHHKVLGIDFWSDQTDARIRQQSWIAYDDGDEEARMAVRLNWYDGHDPQPLIEQQLVVAVAPHGDEELLVELQTTLTPQAESLELGQTNFGLLAVRVAKSISAFFGDGTLTGASGQQTEANLFGEPSAWMDYSGSVAAGVTEGVTYFDHPDNGGFPNKWHVRKDGWMGASICRDGPVLLTRQNPQTWRYLLHAHRGPVDRQVAGGVASRFAASSRFEIIERPEPNRWAAVRRA